MKLQVLGVAAVAAALSVAAGSALSAAQGPQSAGRPPAGGRHVRVLVLTMFSGETQPWLANLKLPVTVNVPGANGPLHCSTDGLCVTTIGEGKSNAGVSVTAILGDRQLSFKGAMINGLTAGVFHDDKRFWPIYERAQALDVPLYIHPALPSPAVIEAY